MKCILFLYQIKMFGLFSKFAFMLLLAFSLLSCNNTSKGDAVNGKSKLYEFADCYGNVEVKELSSPDTVAVFEEDYPYDIDVNGEQLCIIMAKVDTCIRLYNKNDGSFISKTGRIGHGPEDILSADFLNNNLEHTKEDACWHLYDVNANKLFAVSSSGSVEGMVQLMEKAVGMVSLNIDGNYAVGRKIRGGQSLFEIDNLASGSVKTIPLYPQLPDEILHDFGNKLPMLYSNDILANFSCGRIMVSMFYWDMIQIYDLNGILASTICLDEHFDPVTNLNTMMDKKDYIGYSRCYATSGYAYFRRNLMNGKTRNAQESQIVQVDWKGKVKALFRTDVELTTGFCNVYSIPSGMKKVCAYGSLGNRPGEFLQPMITYTHENTFGLNDINTQTLAEMSLENNKEGVEVRELSRKRAAYKRMKGELNPADYNFVKLDEGHFVSLLCGKDGSFFSLLDSGLQSLQRFGDSPVEGELSVLSSRMNLKGCLSAHDGNMVFAPNKLPYLAKYHLENDSMIKDWSFYFDRSFMSVEITTFSLAGNGVSGRCWIWPWTTSTSMCCIWTSC